MTAMQARVMVVDDNVDAAEVLGEALTARGYEARVVFDGPSAIALAATFAPHLGLLDLGLPGMDGFEVARRLRKAPGGSDLKLVTISGYGHEADRELSRAAGFDAHLVKPVDLDAIAALIARLLRSPTG